MKVRLLVLSMLVVLFLTAGAPAQDVPPVDDLSALLVWLASGVGGPVVVGFVYALLMEYWPAFHNLKRWVKFSAGIGLSAALAFGSQWLLSQPGLIEQIEPVFVTVVAAITGMLSWTAQQVGVAFSERQGLNATAKKIANGGRR